MRQTQMEGPPFFAHFNNDVVRLLLENGADIHAVDNNKTTILHNMLSNVFIAPETIQMTLDQGVNVNARDKDGQTPLHAFACPCHHKDIQLFTELFTGCNRAIHD